VSIVEALLPWIAKAKPARVILGDAPLQSCDFENLLEQSNYVRLPRLATDLGIQLTISDFRRTVIKESVLSQRTRDNHRGERDYVLVDAGGTSYLEPISGRSADFRVTQYNPNLMRTVHSKGKHQYLIAAEVLQADVILNIPKLKTHLKAGITAALKNLVGINGNKDFLPHHVKGGSAQGGDCYEGFSSFKHAAENVLDLANKMDGVARRVLNAVAVACLAPERLLGRARRIEGAWYGNDTVWRMCLDLNRILLHCDKTGALHPSPQRNILHLTDAIVCGEGNGPLHPMPKSLHAVSLGMNAASVDAVHAMLMGLDWSRVPLVRESLSGVARELFQVRPDEIRALINGSMYQLHEVPVLAGTFRTPDGWIGHCERIVHEAVNAVEKAIIEL
jgi:hypothetical protein